MTPAGLLHPDLETAKPGALASLQARLWQPQWHYVRTHSAFYRQKLGAAAHRELTLDGLRELPLTDKEEMRASRRRRRPSATTSRARARGAACTARQRHVRRALTSASRERDVRRTRRRRPGMFCAGARPGHASCTASTTSCGPAASPTT